MRQTPVTLKSRAVRLLFAVVLFMALFGRAPSVSAQPAPVPAGSTLFAGSTQSESFPIVSMSVFVVDPFGLPIQSLGADAFAVTENGAVVASDRLSLHTDTSVPLDVVVVMDRSTDAGSWASTQTAVFGLLEQLRTGDEIALVSYAETVDVLTAPTREIGQARAVLAGAAPGGTLNALNQAIAQGLELLGPDDGRRRALVVIANGATDIVTDGVAQGPAAESLVQTARALGASIHMMNYGPAVFQPELLQFATSTGGRPIAVSNAPDLGGHVQSLPALLRQGYSISYESALPADGSQALMGVALAGSAPVERAFVARPGNVIVKITQPQDGATVSGQVVLGLSAEAPAPIRSVTFALEDGEVITSTAGAVSGIIWDSAAVAPGPRRVSVTVQDTAGNTGVDDVGLVVRVPLRLEVIPPPGSVQVGSIALVTATVESAFSNPVVELFVGRTQVGMKANPVGPAVFEVDTAELVPGSYGIFVRASNSAGYTVTDNSHVMTVVAPPETVNTTAALAIVRVRDWLARSWPWIALGLAVLLALALGAWLAWRLRASAAQRQAQRAAERARLVPQVRMLLSNTGNTRTRYRLLAQDSARELRFTFLLDGVPLQTPAVARMERAPAVSNGAAVAVPVAAAAPGANGGATPVQGIPAAAAAGVQSAGQAAGMAGQLFAGLGQVVPGAAGTQFRQMAGGIRSQQSSVARANFSIGEAVGDVQDVAHVGSKMTGAVAPAQAAAASPAPAPARPAPAPANPAFALQTPAGTPVSSAPAVWVLTPPISPGETLGIDIHVAPLRRMGRNKEVQFTVLSAPLDLESIPPVVDEVNLRLGASR